MSDDAACSAHAPPATTPAAGQEPSAAAPQPVADPPHAILVLDDNARVAQWFRDHFGAMVRVIGANTVSAALDALERHDIGVIVTSEVVGGESTFELLCALKQHYPMLMAVLLAATHDSALVVRLIDEAKVCRVLFKPVKTGAVDLALKEALKLHAAHRSDPAAWHRDDGAERGTELATASTRPSLLERLRARLGWRARRADSA